MSTQLSQIAKKAKLDRQVLTAAESWSKTNGLKMDIE